MSVARPHRFYPVFFDLEGRRAVVIGEGDEAFSRVAALLDVGAIVRVVARRPSTRLRALAESGRLELRERAFAASDLEGAAIAVACADEDTNRLAREAATALRVPLNVVDAPELCDWIHGAVVRRDALVIAISTSGAAPALAVRIKERLAAQYGTEYGQFLELAAEHREPIARTGLSFDARRVIWYRIADSDALEALRRGDEAHARAVFAREIAHGEAEARQQ